MNIVNRFCIINMTKKRITIFLLFLLIIVLLLAGFYFLWQKKYKSEESTLMTQQIENIQNNGIINQITKIKEQYSNIEENNNQQIKIDNEIYDLLLNRKDVVICSHFENQKSTDLCYKMIAQENLDKQLCDKIINAADREECQKNIDLSLAVKNKNLLFCYNLDDDINKKACLDKLIKNSDVQSDDCDQIPLAFSNSQEDFAKHIYKNELRDECKAKIILKSAKENENVNLCDDIPLYYEKALCFGYFKKVSMSSDHDNDGLTFVEEYRYSVNPNNPDTDGDSYLDGAEVKDGYNPNGQGKLKLNLY